MEEHPGRRAPHDADEGGVQALPALEQGQVALAHAQDVVQPQLLLPLLHEEAVDVQHQDGGENAGDDHAQAHHDLDILRPPQLVDAGVEHQGGHDVESGGQPHQGQQIREVEPAVLP